MLVSFFAEYKEHEGEKGWCGTGSGGVLKGGRKEMQKIPGLSSLKKFSCFCAFSL